MSNEETKDPTPEEQGSEVARLLETIARQYEAAQRGLTGVAIGTAKHDFITARMEKIEDARQQLIEIVGDEKEANKLVVQQLEESDKDQEPKENEEDPYKTQDLKEDEGENK